MQLRLAGLTSRQSRQGQAHVVSADTGRTTTVTPAATEVGPNASASAGARGAASWSWIMTPPPARPRTSSPLSVLSSGRQSLTPPTHPTTMDPLDSTSAWGGSGAAGAGATSSLPSASDGPWGQSSAASTSSASTVPDLREPRVYGDPVPALPAPSAEATKQQTAPFLRVRIAGVDRNRKDLLVRFDSSVSGVVRWDFAERCQARASREASTSLSTSRRARPSLSA